MRVTRGDAPIALDAIAHGKHVLCEKPMAMNAREAGLPYAAIGVVLFYGLAGLMAAVFLMLVLDTWLGAVPGAVSCLRHVPLAFRSSRAWICRRRCSAQHHGASAAPVSATPRA